jgi:uncharacterized protein (DUF433 family)
MSTELTLAPLIVADARTLSGKPRIVGTRISVAQVIEELSHGKTVDDLLQAYPALTRDGVLACLAYAHKSVEEDAPLFAPA